MPSLAFPLSAAMLARIALGFWLGIAMIESAMALPDLHDKRAVLLESLDDPKALEAWLLDTMQRGARDPGDVAWIRAVWAYSQLAADSAVDLHKTRQVDLVPIFAKALERARSGQFHAEAIDIDYALVTIQDKVNATELDRLIHDASAHHLPDSQARMRAIKALHLISTGEVSAGTRLMNELTQELDGKLQLKDYELLVLKNYIALGLYSLNQSEKAIRLLDEVDTLASRLNLRWFRMPILHNLGRAWLSSDEGEAAGLRAQTYATRHLSLAQEFHMPWDEAMARVTLAQVDMRRKQWEAALQNAQHAAAIFVEAEDPMRQAEAELIVAQIETQRQRWDAALPFALQALTHVSRSGHKRQLLQIHDSLHQIYKAKGQIKDALAHLEQYTELHKSLAAEREKNEFRKMTVTMGLALEEERNRNQAQELASQKRMNRWQTLAVLLLTLGVLGIVLAYLRIRKTNQQIAALNAFVRTQVLSRFLPPELVQEISEGRSRFHDAAERCEVTVLFADLCSFTRATEQLGAENVSTILNQFLASMTEVIFHHGGTIDKFIGDGIMVIFGAPTPLSIAEQAQKAALCAQSMMKELERLNLSWRVEFDWEFQMRIGLHQGTSIVGTFGSDRRADYTVVGSAVNIASRVEGEAEPNQILLTSTVAQHLRSALVQPAGCRQLRGVSVAVEVFALSPEADAVTHGRAG